MKKIRKIILTLVSVAMSFVGLSLLIVLQDKNDLQNTIVINVDGNDIDRELPSVNINGLYPGKEECYTISLIGSLSDEYYISLAFYEDVSKNNDLAEYLEVKIMTKRIEIKKSLKELFDGVPVSLGDYASEINIAYYMPIDIGNESQNTTATFHIELMAKYKKE